MGFNIYRFEVLKEVARAGSNVVYEARDTSDSSLLKLYEWTPLPDEAAAAFEKFSRVRDQLNGVEAFANSHRLYLAGPQGDAKRALELLQAYKLFPGVWPDLLPRTEPNAASKSAGPIASGPVIPGVAQPQRSRRFLFPILVLLAVVGAAAFWWSRQGSPSSTPDPTTPGNSPVRIATGSVQIKYFIMEPQLAQAGETVTVSWEVINAKEVWIKGVAPQPILVRHSGKESYLIPRTTRQVELEAKGEGDNNSDRKILPLHFNPAPG